MPNTNSLAVVFENVSLQIAHKKILNNISLTIPEGSIVGVLGPNGAGKTTLLSLIIGIAKQTSGEITVLGEKLPSRNNNLKSQLGVVFQETSLYEELTVAENLLFFASLYSVQNPKERTKEVLELLDILDRAKDPVHTLSGGLKRRTAIARALLHNPKLLIVDEPTLGVDVETRHAIWEHLKFLKSQGHTVIIASNYLDEAQAICDTVAVLNEGNLLVSDSPQKLIEKTGHSLDIESSKESAEKIANVLKKTEGVIRVETIPSGLSVFIKGDTVQDTIINTIIKTAPVNGFRFRPADLAEVFKMLKET
jgi:ABC-2 type transport system ATP-binding protein